MTTETESGSCCGTGFCGSSTTIDVQGVGVTAVCKVSGMACGHYEGAVSQEISALEGVTAVTADARTGEVTVASAAMLDEETVRTAVDEAGYELVGRV